MCETTWQVTAQKHAKAESQAGGSDAPTQYCAGLMAHVTTPPLYAPVWGERRGHRKPESEEGSTGQHSTSEEGLKNKQYPGRLQGCISGREYQWASIAMDFNRGRGVWCGWQVDCTTEQHSLWDCTSYLRARLWSPCVPHQSLKTKELSDWLLARIVTWARAVVLKVWSAKPAGSQRSFQGTCRVKTIFIVILRCCLPFLLCWHLHWWTLAQIKAEVPKWTSSHYILYFHTLTVSTKTLSRGMSLMKL